MPSDSVRKHGLLRKHPVISTRDPARMHETLSKMYGVRKFEVEGDRGNFFGQANRVQLRSIGLDFCAYGADVAIEFPEVSWFRQKICLGSVGRTILNEKTLPLSIDRTCVIPPGQKINSYYAANYHHLVFRIDPDALRHKLQSLIDGPCVRSIEFVSEATFEKPELVLLRRMILFLVNELDCADSQFPELALAEFEQAMMVAFLCSHKHNFSDFLYKPPRDVAPWQVRLTEGYIEANWDKPITVEAISEATGVGIRSIFKSFKEARGQSPMAFAKDVRLRAAQEMLRQASPTTSVSGVALQCGFHNLGHFAREYKLRFGELPSETLDRAQER